MLSNDQVQIKKSTHNFKLHPMDHSNSGYKVSLATHGHSMTIRNRWESCGLIQEIISCSCGFASTQHSGGGCWQEGHDKAKLHEKMDMVHQDLFNFNE